MGDYKVISAFLTGGWSKKDKIIARYLMCDRNDKCTAFADGMCHSKSLLSSGCPFAKINSEHGYTERAKHVQAFRNKVKSHPEYNKLNQSNEPFDIAGDDAMFFMKYIKRKEEYGTWIFYTPAFGEGYFSVPLKDLTAEFIVTTLKYKPVAFFSGNVITEYEKVIVPRFLARLKRLMPELHREVVSLDPSFDVPASYIGRKAFLKTLSPNINVKIDNCDWHWDGEKMTSTNYKNPLIFNMKVEKIVTVPTDELTVAVADNGWVNEKTVFSD